jgi:hypothetical protein
MDRAGQGRKWLWPVLRCYPSTRKIFSHVALPKIEPSPFTRDSQLPAAVGMLEIFGFYFASHQKQNRELNFIIKVHRVKQKCDEVLLQISMQKLYVNACYFI